MRYPEDSILALLRTEKSTRQEPQGKYLFLVHRAANKLQIRQAVEQLYKVKVRKVTTSVMPGKMKRVRYQAGKTPDFKKAIVTLKAGDTIDLAV